MSEKIDNFVIEAGQSASNMREQILNKKVFDVTDQKVPQIIVGTGDSDDVKNLSLTVDGVLFGKNNNEERELVSTKINDSNYNKIFRKDPLYLSNSLKNITDSRYKTVLQESSDFYCLNMVYSTKISAISPTTENNKILGQIKSNNVTKPFYIENYQMKEAVGITSNKNRHYVFTINYDDITINGNDIYGWEDSENFEKLSSASLFENGYPYVSRIKIEVVFDEREIVPNESSRIYSNAYLKMYVDMNYKKGGGGGKVSFEDGANQIVVLYPVQVTANNIGFKIDRVDGSYFSIPLVQKNFSLILSYGTIKTARSFTLSQKDWNFFIDKGTGSEVYAPTWLLLHYNHERKEFSEIEWSPNISCSGASSLGVRSYESE